MSNNLPHSLIYVTESPPHEKVQLLSRTALCQALGQMISDPPCHRTISRWAKRGLPYRPNPANGRKYYLLSEVVAWLKGEPLAEDYRVRSSSLAWKVRQQAE